MKRVEDDPPAGPALKTFDINHELAMLSAWQPPRTPHEEAKQWRWRTWEEFLNDFRRVRPELVEQFPTRDGTRPMFGDLVLEYRRRYGAAALAEAYYHDIRALAPDED